MVVIISHSELSEVTAIVFINSWKAYHDYSFYQENVKISQDILEKILPAGNKQRYSINCKLFIVNLNNQYACTST